jgi:hypothetical protein
MIRPRPSFRRRPAKGNAFPKAGVPSTASNPVPRGSLLYGTGQRPSITPPPDSRRDGIATGSLSAFVFHTRAPDSDEASSRAWVGGPWPGVVPGIARTYRSAPERFLQPVLPASWCVPKWLCARLFLEVWNHRVAQPKLDPITSRPNAPPFVPLGSWQCSLQAWTPIHARCSTYPSPSPLTSTPSLVGQEY